MPVSFFCKTTALNVWKTVVCVSSAGSKRGRGKGAGRKIAIDYNKGQQIGIGQRRLNLPGLNTSLKQSSERGTLQIKDLGEDPEFQNELAELRKSTNTYKRYRETPLERGWSGRRTHGKQIGPPDDHNETPFTGFNSTVLMCRPLVTMTNKGRLRRMHCLVVTGNGRGLAGFSTAIGNDGRGTLRRARNKAAQTLVEVPRFEDRTVMHNFFSRYYFTTVFVEKRPEGHGIRAHRIIRAICKAFGIKDLYAKVEGSTNNQINLTKAFFLGLMNQKKYQDIADEKGLHLVEMCDETYNYPKVLASPKGRLKSEDQIRASNESLDFTYYIYEGKIKQVTPKPQKYYKNLDNPGWLRHLDKQDLEKNREKTKLMLAARYGDVNVKDVFPAFKSNAAAFKEN